MLGLSGGKRISTISQAVLIQYRIVTDGHTDRWTDTFLHQISLLCTVSRG